MSYKEVGEYISNGLKKGVSLFELKSNLVSKGWPEKIVDESIKEMEEEIRKIKSLPQGNFVSDYGGRKKSVWGVKVLGVLFFISAFVYFSLGILLFLAIDFLANLIGFFDSSLFVTFAVVFLVLFVLCLLMGIGLLKYKRWARIFSIIFLSIGIISGGIGVYLGIEIASVVFFLVNVFFVVYLGFNKGVLNAFRKG